DAPRFRGRDASTASVATFQDDRRGYDSSRAGLVHDRWAGRAVDADQIATKTPSATVDLSYHGRAHVRRTGAVAIVGAVSPLARARLSRVCDCGTWFTAAHAMALPLGSGVVEGRSRVVVECLFDLALGCLPRRPLFGAGGRFLDHR